MITRRNFDTVWPPTVLLILMVLVPHASADEPNIAAKAIDIGSRRELFVDRFLIESISDSVQSKLHQPTPGEVVLVTDKPWEGNTSAYYTIFRDEDADQNPLYRMYYRGSHYDVESKKAAHPEVVCYAESRDGVRWTRPNLGVCQWDGSSDNNIVWDGIGSHCFAPFKDSNPHCAADAHYKAISRGHPKGKKGLYVFQSPDGIHWKLIKNEPVITEGYFDSQNLAFWDPHTKQYVDYHRTFIDGVRSIMTCTSPDFVTWTKPVLLSYGDAPDQHLYTNAIRPYFRAPHIRIGFPTRYLPDDQNVEPLFMASRDGLKFKRYLDPVIPQSAPLDRSGNRSNYMANGLVTLPGNDTELSVYGTEAYYTGPDSRLRRFTYRMDGFVSLHGSVKAGEVLTKPITFTGSQLQMNVAAGPKGFVQVEIQDATGKPIDGFALNDCEPIEGDSIEKIVAWKTDASLATVAGRVVRLRIVIEDADVYSFRFAE